MQIIQSIQNRIYEIRGERVMLDRDLANLYEVETKALNLAVKRNIKRFPSDFMFQLTKEEFTSLRFQIETLENSEPSRSQFVTLKAGRGKYSKYLPYAFTEQGVAMLSGVINSDKAISMNIAIMRAFVSVRQVLLKQNDIKEQLREIKERIGEHDVQLNQIYDAMENLLDNPSAPLRMQPKENGMTGKGLGLSRVGHPIFKGGSPGCNFFKSNL
jgi:DNA repair ATPase RecN